MRKCSNCGEPLDDDALFCTSCGTKQEEGRRCIHCGALIDADSIFCTSCGGRQESIQQPVEQPVQQPVQQPQQSVPIQPQPEYTDPDIFDDDSDNKRKQYMIIAGAVLAVLLCVGGWFLYQNTRGNNAETGEETEYAPLYVQYRGEIDNKYPITMELEYEIGSSGTATGVISGNYYYDKQGPDKRLSLSGFFKDGKTELFETDETGRQTGHFIGGDASEVFEGEFINANGKSMPFKLRQE